jgi:hypothetical protein
MLALICCLVRTRQENLPPSAWRTWQTYEKWGFVKMGMTSFPGNIMAEFGPMIVMRRFCT